jgi:hypothetical protein
MIADQEYVLDQVIPRASDDFIDIDKEDSNKETSDKGGGEEAEEDMVKEEIIEGVDELDLINDPGDSHGQSSFSGSGENEETAEIYLEPVVAEKNLAIPENTWTQLLHLNSKALNQKMFLIYSRLQAVTHSATGAMG